MWNSFFIKGDFDMWQKFLCNSAQLSAQLMVEVSSAVTQSFSPLISS